MNIAAAYQRWTAIDGANPDTWPPLHEHVLMFRRDPEMREWYKFHDDTYRQHMLVKFGFTHWREEMTCDSP